MSQPRKKYSYEAERAYYAQAWPSKPLPYDHLDRYLGWVDGEAVFTGKHVLDIGAGECTYSRLILDRYQPADVVASDLFLERMRPAQRATGNPRLRFAAADCFALPFRDQVFDVVFGSFILHQLPDLEDAIVEIKRVLRDGGQYVGLEPSPNNVAHLYRYFRGVHSPNQFLLNARHLDAFKDHGFEVHCSYVNSPVRFLKLRFLQSCLGIQATLPTVLQKNR